MGRLPVPLPIGEDVEAPGNLAITEPVSSGFTAVDWDDRFGGLYGIAAGKGGRFLSFGADSPTDETPRGGLEEPGVD